MGHSNLVSPDSGDDGADADCGGRHLRRPANPQQRLSSNGFPIDLLGWTGWFRNLIAMLRPRVLAFLPALRSIPLRPALEGSRQRTAILRSPVSLRAVDLRRDLRLHVV